MLTLAKMSCQAIVVISEVNSEATQQAFSNRCRFDGECATIVETLATDLSHAWTAISLKLEKVHRSCVLLPTKSPLET